MSNFVITAERWSPGGVTVKFAPGPRMGGITLSPIIVRLDLDDVDDLRTLLKEQDEVDEGPALAVSYADRLLRIEDRVEAVEGYLENGRPDTTLERRLSELEKMASAIRDGVWTPGVVADSHRPLETRLRAVEDYLENGQQATDKRSDVDWLAELAGRLFGK